MFTKKSLIAFLKAFYHANKRVPTRKDLNKHKHLPSYSTYRKFFGSYSNAVKEAKLKKGKVMKKIILLLIAIVLSGNVVYAGMGVDVFYKSRIINAESTFLGIDKSARGFRFFMDKRGFRIYSELEFNRGYSLYIPKIDKNIFKLGVEIKSRKNIVIGLFSQDIYFVNQGYYVRKNELSQTHIYISIPIFYYKAEK